MITYEATEQDLKKNKSESDALTLSYGHMPHV
jgi:hypothetical protein